MNTYTEMTSLIVVDMQNDFGDPNGSLYVSGGEQLVEIVNREIADAVAAGASVVYTQDWHPASTPHFEKDGGIWPVHCVAGSWGSEFLFGLRVDGPVVRKGTGGEDGYSGFTVRDPQSGDVQPTEMQDLLTERGVDHVVVVGLATDYCVKETALDARRAGYPTTVLARGVRAVNVEPGDGDQAFQELAEAGVVIDTT